MTESEIKIKIEAQRAFFAKGLTYDINYRINTLKRLRKYIREHIDELRAGEAVEMGHGADDIDRLTQVKRVTEFDAGGEAEDRGIRGGQTLKAICVKQALLFQRSHT